MYLRQVPSHPSPTLPRDESSWAPSLPCLLELLMIASQGGADDVYCCFIRAPTKNKIDSTVVRINGKRIDHVLRIGVHLPIAHFRLRYVHMSSGNIRIQAIKSQSFASPSLLNALQFLLLPTCKYFPVTYIIWLLTGIICSCLLLFNGWG